MPIPDRSDPGRAIAPMKIGHESYYPTGAEGAAIAVTTTDVRSHLRLTKITKNQGKNHCSPRNESRY
ncbi:MAG: hypothetical protein GDA48_09410 [Hormoscilla sp. GM102CHS1]|nr:hypothetical protein [Hormoscilla sp. GM102CHS1]